jgi:hypothetical protein
VIVQLVLAVAYRDHIPWIYIFIPDGSVGAAISDDDGISIAIQQIVSDELSLPLIDGDIGIG